MIVECPTCKKPVEWGEKSPFRPFCSKRCRLIDIGAWADGSYSIEDPNGGINPDDIEPDHKD
jgi:endogenous inhibitor of DNA gyrase (YacG/DUF329 family)